MEEGLGRGGDRYVNGRDPPFRLPTLYSSAEGKFFVEICLKVIHRSPLP